MSGNNNKSSDKGIHKGHRSRMKSAVAEYGIESLKDHQVLEVMLFYALPRIDTNPLAHRLISEFGSLKAVLEADIKQLENVDGVGRNAAELIRLFRIVAQRYMFESSFEPKRRRFKNTESFRLYFEGVLIGVKTEEVHVLLLDTNMRFVKEMKISEGSKGRVELNQRKIVDFVVKNDCENIVIAHNHPDTICSPSKEDIAATKELIETLEKLDIKLLDHIIVGKNGSNSIRSSEFRRSLWGDEDLFPEQTSADGENNHEEAADDCICEDDYGCDYDGSSYDADDYERVCDSNYHFAYENDIDIY